MAARSEERQRTLPTGNAAQVPNFNKPSWDCQIEHSERSALKVTSRITRNHLNLAASSTPSSLSSTSGSTDVGSCRPTRSFCR